LADSHARFLLAWTILAWPAEYVFYFLFIHAMVVNVRKSGFWVNIELSERHLAKISLTGLTG
jgi:hypothetical protein